MKTPTVAIFDDHPLYRHGLNQYLTALGCEVVIEEASYVEFLKKIESCTDPPCMCFIDLDMINTDGYRTAKLILQNWPTIIVIILSMSMDDDMERQCYEAGVHSYIEKINPSKKIKEVINRFKNRFVAISKRVKRFAKGNATPVFKAA